MGSISVVMQLSIFYNYEIARKISITFGIHTLTIHDNRVQEQSEELLSLFYISLKIFMKS